MNPRAGNWCGWTDLLTLMWSTRGSPCRDWSVIKVLQLLSSWHVVVVVQTVLNSGLMLWHIILYAYNLHVTLDSAKCSTLMYFSEVFMAVGFANKLFLFNDFQTVCLGCVRMLEIVQTRLSLGTLLTSCSAVIHALTSLEPPSGFVLFSVLKVKLKIQTLTRESREWLMYSWLSLFWFLCHTWVIVWGVAPSGRTGSPSAF